MTLLLLLAPMSLMAANHDSGSEPAKGQLNPADVVQTLPGMPDRGITMKRVRAQLGDPQRVIDAVGEPPITRWVYERFTVYFEHNRVLHSVRNRDRASRE